MLIQHSHAYIYCTYTETVMVTVLVPPVHTALEESLLCAKMQLKLKLL